MNRFLLRLVLGAFDFLLAFRVAFSVYWFIRVVAKASSNPTPGSIIENIKWRELE